MKRPLIGERLPNKNEVYTSITRAFRKVNEYLASNNQVAAYVLAFSILEDRAMAAYIKCYKHATGKDLSEKNLNNFLFSNAASRLLRLQAINSDVASEIIRLADERNGFVHEMIWNLDSINNERVNNVIDLVRMIDKSSALFLKKAVKKNEDGSTIAELHENCTFVEGR